jgi:hypothetical protein
MIKTDYTREDLIALCERAIVAEENWGNEDTANAQKKIGACWALLKAGCDFRVISSNDGQSVATDERTIWLDVFYSGFTTFEDGPDAEKEKEGFYIPTSESLKEANGEDWY